MRLLYGTLIFYLAALVLDVSYFMITQHRIGDTASDTIPVLSYAQQEEGEPLAYRVAVAIPNKDSNSRARVMAAFNDMDFALIDGQVCLSCTLNACEMDIFGWSQEKYKLAETFAKQVDKYSHGELHGILMLMSDNVASL